MISKLLTLPAEVNRSKDTKDANFDADVGGSSLASTCNEVLRAICRQDWIRLKFQAVDLVSPKFIMDPTISASGV